MCRDAHAEGVLSIRQRTSQPSFRDCDCCGKSKVCNFQCIQQFIIDKFHSGNWNLKSVLDLSGSGGPVERGFIYFRFMPFRTIPILKLKRWSTFRGLARFNGYIYWRFQVTQIPSNVKNSESETQAAV